MYQLFEDVSTLVEQQGMMLDQIDLNIQNAVDYTAKGNEHLKKATQSQKSSRKVCQGRIVLPCLTTRSFCATSFLLLLCSSLA